MYHGSAVVQVQVPPVSERLGVTCISVGTQRGDQSILPRDGEGHPQPDGESLLDGEVRIAHGWTLCYFVSGRGAVEIEDSLHLDVQDGLVILIPPESSYRFSLDRSESFCMYYVAFDGQSLTERKVCTAIDELYPIANIGLHRDVIGMFEQLLSVATERSEGAQRELGATIVLLVAKLVNHLHDARLRRDRPNPAQRARTIMTAYVTSHISIQSLAREIGLPVSTFRRIFRAEFGLSPYQYYLHCKVEAAKDELQRNDAPIRTIAEKLGFADQYHFSRVFTHVTGVRPTEWRSRTPS
jgi:AraC-like DNA-binding protein